MDSLTDRTTSLLRCDDRRRQLDLLSVIGVHSLVHSLFHSYLFMMDQYSPVTISLFPTSIDLDPIFEKDRDLDRFRFSNKAGQSIVLNTSGGPGVTLDRRVSWGNAIIGAVAAASSRRPPLLKSRPSQPLCIHVQISSRVRGHGTLWIRH